MRTPAVLLGLAIALALSVPSTPVLAHTGETPRLIEGDFWEYETNSSLEGILWLNGSYRYEMSGEDDVVVSGVAYHVYVLDLIGDGPIEGDLTFQNATMPGAGTWRIAGRDHLSSSGLKSVYGFVDIRANGTLLPPVNLPWSFRLQNTTQDRILADTWTFPLYDGKAGTLVTDSTSLVEVTLQLGTGPPIMNTTETATTRTIAFQVIDEQPVSLPIGTVDTFVIRETWPDGSVDVLYYSDAVGGNVVVESYNETGVRTGRSALVAYAYAAGAAPPDLLLGLPPPAWAAIGVAAALAVVSILVYRRRLARRRREIEEQTAQDLAGDEITSGPRGRS